MAIKRTNKYLFSNKSGDTAEIWSDGYVVFFNKNGFRAGAQYYQNLKNAVKMVKGFGYTKKIYQYS